MSLLQDVAESEDEMRLTQKQAKWIDRISKGDVPTLETLLAQLGGQNRMPTLIAKGLVSPQRRGDGEIGYVVTSQRPRDWGCGRIVIP